MQEVLLFDLGIIEYEKAYVLQKRMADLIAEGKFQQTLLLLEHFPVYTIGKSGSERSLQNDIQVLKVDRGGDITYHGPGQLVGYSLLHLGKRRVSQYIWKLEESLVLLLSNYCIEAQVRKGYPGVWVGEEKIASVGVRIKDDVTYHGFALNVTVDLEAFHRIKPCGLSVTMTSMQKILSRVISMETVKRDYAKAFEKCFDVDLKEESSDLLEKIHS